MTPLHDVIARRFSPRAFADRPVSRDDLDNVLEAARWAASCFNEQPWRFVVATRDEGDAHARLAALLTDKNRAWAERAPVLMLTVARTSFSRNGKPNRHAWHDVGLAVGNLSAQATAIGLAVHQMAGFDRDRARAVYDIPDDFDPVTAIALGYRDESLAMPVRARKPLDELIYDGTWR